MLEIGCGTDKSGKHTIAIGEDLCPFRILIDGRPVGPPLGSRMRAEMVAEWAKGLDNLGALLGPVGPEPSANDREREAPRSSGASWRDRLVMDPEVSVTSPVVKGTRITAKSVVSLFHSFLVSDHPSITFPGLGDDDIRACFLYAIDEGGRDA